MRKNLKKYLGQTITVSARISRKGYVSDSRTRTKHINLLLSDIRDEHGKLLASHTWVPKCSAFKKICYNDQRVILNATVGTYIKKGHIAYCFSRINWVNEVMGPITHSEKQTGIIERATHLYGHKTNTSKSDKRRYIVLSEVSNKSCRLEAIYNQSHDDNTIVLNNLALAGDRKVLSKELICRHGRIPPKISNGDKVSIIAEIRPGCYRDPNKGLGGGYGLKIRHIEKGS